MHIDFSNPLLFNKVYFPFFHTKKRYIFLMGSAWSWKSVSIAQDLIMKSFLYWNRTLCTRKTKESIKDSVYQELLNVIDDWNLKDYFTITKSPLYILNKKSWSDFLFRWIDDVEKLKSISKINTIWIEEATELQNREIYDQLDLRLRWTNPNWYRLIVSFNPVDWQHWLNTDFWSKWENEETMLLHTTYLDNRFVWDAYLKVMERIKKENPNYYKIYWLWKWWILKWLIFENWTEISEVPEWAELLWYWQDYWFTNDPTTLVWLYKFNWELIFDELLYQTQLSNWEIVSKWKNLCNPNVTVYWDSASPDKINELQLGWMKVVWAKKWPWSIVDWITELQSYTIRITSSSINLIKEISKYVWKEDKNWKSLNEPVGGFDHLLDAMRYVVVMTLWNQKQSTFIDFNDI